MPNPRLAARYAKAIFDLAVERDELEKVYEDMKMLHQVCKVSHDFVAILRSPIIPTDKKEKIIGAVFKGKVNPLTASFTRLLVDKGRENNFLDITTAFIEQYKELKGIQTLRITTAYPVSEEVKREIVERVKPRVNVKHLEVEEKINPDVIGGFRLELRDFLIDATVLHILEKARKEFQNNDYVFRLR
jgi:F-type H+-transporting ATPase subunit delta